MTGDNFEDIFPDQPQEIVSTNTSISEIPTSALEARIYESGIQLDPGQLAAIKRYTDNLNSAVHASTIMKCAGDRCAILHACWLKMSGIKLPIGKLCPIEASIMDDCVQKYCNALKIDPETPSGKMELMQIWEIARAEVIEFRANASLAKDPQVVRNKLTGIGLDGTQLFSDVAAPELDIMERWTKLKNKTRNELLATRKAQVMAGRQIDDNAKKMSVIIARAKEVKRIRQLRDEGITYVEIKNTESTNESV